MSESSELLQEMISDQWLEFDIGWKKQMLYFLLASFSYQQQKILKPAWNCIHIAQSMANEVCKEYPRSLDYSLAVNTYTGWLFMKNAKIRASLEFIQAAEASLLKLVEFNVQGKLPANQQAYQDQVDALYRQYGPYQIDIYNQKTK